MKSKGFILSVLFLSAMILAGPVMAQNNGQGRANRGDRQVPPREGFNQRIPDLSEQQQEQIKSIRLQMMEKNQPLQNQINEKEARLQSLVISENVDQNEVNKVIDDLGNLKATLMKNRVASQLDIRKLLTEEQKIIFNQQLLRMSDRAGVDRGFRKMPHGG